jgi:hypothetical protein
VKTDVPVPMAKCAFDDPGTRRVCERARRRAFINLLVRVGIWMALLIVASTVETDAQHVEGAASFLLIPTAFLLSGPANKLRWLRTVDSVLRSFPWQHCVVAREQGAQVSRGAAVRVGLGADAGNERWSATMAARTWRLRRPRPGHLEGGAWFAGAPDRGGVVARPGGQVLVTVQRP